MLTVGGTQSNDRLYKTYFSGSNYGSCVDIFAPGQAVVSASIRSTTSYTVTDGTSLSAPIVSGAAAVYWNMLPDSATGTQVKHLLLDTCTKGKISDIPSAFNSVTSNCLLHVTKLPSQKIFHAVKFEAIEGLIKQMEQHGYAVSYMQEYTNSGNTKQFSLIFNHMGAQIFKTLLFINKDKLMKNRRQMRLRGLQISFIYDLRPSNATGFLVVFTVKKICAFKITFRAEIKAKNTLRMPKGLILHSTSVFVHERRKNPLYTSLYCSKLANETYFFGSINNKRLLEFIDDKMINGYHLKHLNTFVIRGRERHSLVLHRQTKPSDIYYITYDLQQDKVQEYVNKLITTGYTINVVAGINTPSNNVRYIVAYESTKPS